MTDVNALVAALCAAIVACEPERRYDEEAVEPEPIDVGGGWDKYVPRDHLRDALARVCALLGEPASGALRAEMERERVAEKLAEACFSVTIVRAAHLHLTVPDPLYSTRSCVRAALALATEADRG